MKKALTYIIVITLVSMFVGGCGNSLDSSSASDMNEILISMDLNPDANFKSQVSSTSDISDIIVDAFYDNEIVVKDLPLMESYGVWSETIVVNKAIVTVNFTAHAFDSSGTQIFTATTIQTLNGENDNVILKLEPVPANDKDTINDEEKVNLEDIKSVNPPKIEKITINDELTVSTSGEVTISVSGEKGDTLTYEILSALNSGDFNSYSGKLSVKGKTALIIITYFAPADPGTYTHYIDISDSLGNNTSTSFSFIVVASKNPDDEIIEIVNPVIQNISAEKSGNSLIFTADVTDENEGSFLTYLWEFDGDLHFDDETATPATLLKYKNKVSGTVTLTVLNDQDGETTSTYTLIKNQFKENNDDENDDDDNKKKDKKDKKKKK